MSFRSQFQPFRDSNKLVFNDRFMGDEGAYQLANFITQHRRIQVLQIKSNDISGQGFKVIFEALTKNVNFRQLVIEYNDLGQSQYDQWQDKLISLIQKCPKFQRLNISNNKITSESFARISSALAASKSLRMIEIRYNQISSNQIDFFVGELKKNKNQTLLFVELSGNKIRKQSLDNLEAFLKINRSKTPLSKDKIMMTGVLVEDRNERMSNNNTFYMNKTNAIDQLSKQNVLRHLQQILDQNRKDTAQMKIRLQKQLQQLIKREKNDARQLQDLQNKCNQLVIQNRNLKFQIDRTNSQYQQMQRDQQLHMRVYQQKLRQANKQLQDLQVKYQDVQERMQKQHDLKMKQITREWQSRLRSVQQKIRTAQNQNNQLENQIKKGLQKRQRAKAQYLQEQNQVRHRVQQQEAQKYSIKIASLQAKLRQVEETRQKLIRRNQDILYQIQKTQSNAIKQNTQLQQQINDLKLKQQQFTIKNKQFLTKNQKLKSQIQLKEITIQKLQEQLNRLNQQIDLKKRYNRQQVDKILLDNVDLKKQREQDKLHQIQKLNQLQTALRTAQLQNTKLRQQYSVLAQKLHINLGKAIQDVFYQNNLF